jgi:hypothetical protein
VSLTAVPSGGAFKCQLVPVTPGFTKTYLNHYQGTETVEEGAREAVRLALLGADGPTGTFTHATMGSIPW